MDRLFDNVLRGFGGGWPTRPQRQAGEAQPLWRFDTSLGLTAPVVDVAERDGDFRITAELPGMDATNVELVVTEDMLTIRGEKKEEKEEKTENYHRSERRFGSFQRSFQLPRGVDREQDRGEIRQGRADGHPAEDRRGRGAAEEDRDQAGLEQIADGRDAGSTISSASNALQQRPGTARPRA